MSAVTQRTKLHRFFVTAVGESKRVQVRLSNEVAGLTHTDIGIY